MALMMTDMSQPTWLFSLNMPRFFLAISNIRFVSMKHF